MPRTYDPKKVVLSFGGIPISGYADGTFINVARESDSFTKTSGADGVVSRAKSNDKSGMVTVTLAQTSPSNDILSSIAQLDEKLNTGVLPLICKDNSGRSLFAANNAWIRKPADAPFGKEIDNREWTIDCENLENFIGGNSDAAIIPNFLQS